MGDKKINNRKTAIIRKKIINAPDESLLESQSAPEQSVPEQSHPEVLSVGFPEDFVRILARPVPGRVAADVRPQLTFPQKKYPCQQLSSTK
jgi:hypothetical protein